MALLEAPQDGVAQLRRSPLDAETDRVRELYEKEAPRYDWSMAFFERLLFKDARRWVCSKAEGDVLEIAIGTGRNLRTPRTSA